MGDTRYDQYHDVIFIIGCCTELNINKKLNNHIHNQSHKHRIKNSQEQEYISHKLLTTRQWVPLVTMSGCLMSLSQD